MMDRNTESYKKSESQVKKMLLAMINKRREALGLEPLRVKRIPKI